MHWGPLYYYLISTICFPLEFSRPDIFRPRKSQQKEIDMHNSIKHLTFAILLVLGLSASTAQAQTTVVSDDFSSNTLSNSNRLRVENTTDEWVAFPDSLWTVSGGTLSNAGTTPGLESEGAALRVLDVASQPAGLTELTFSFDYTVGTGSDLFFYATGLYDGTLTPNFQLHNTGSQNGGIQSQYDQNSSNSNFGDFTGVNLFNGAASPNGATGDAVSFAAGTSGTFTQTVDISNFITAGTTELDDFQLLTLGFASNVTDNTGAGAISIDNFVLSAGPVGVPEPSSIAMLSLGFAAVAMRRRRSAG